SKEGCWSGGGRGGTRRELLRTEAGQLFQLLLDGFQAAGVAEDDEDGVVAGDGAEDLGPLLPVEGLGDGLCAAGEGLDEEEVADAFRADEERGEQALERRALLPGLGRERVVGPALGI